MRAERRHQRARVIRRRMAVAARQFVTIRDFDGVARAERALQEYSRGGGRFAKYNMAHGCSRHG